MTMNGREERPTDSRHHRRKHVPIYDNVASTIGSTPLVRLNRVNADGLATVAAKLESFNPGGSVKDRIGLSMIEAAEQEGSITPGSTVLVEPTSGNTGIALAFVCAARGYRLILTMPETMSIERRNLLKAWAPSWFSHQAPRDDRRHRRRRGDRRRRRTPCAPAVPEPGQSRGPSPDDRGRNHHDTDGEVDVFIAGVGTGGTITGVGEVLRAHAPRRAGRRRRAEDSPVLAGGKPGRTRSRASAPALCRRFWTAT